MASGVEVRHSFSRRCKAQDRISLPITETGDSSSTMIAGSVSIG
jgi:hypothetical protein